MSVANLAFMSDRILCLSDTLQYQGRKPVSLCDRKTDVPEHGRFALVTRGLCVLGDAVSELACRYEDHDEAERHLAAWFLAFADLSKDDPARAVEATIMGWSELHQDLRAVRFLLNRTRPLKVEVLGRGWHVSPKHPKFVMPATVREDTDTARMVKVALAQQMALNGLNDLNECIGGCMHVTTVTRAGAVQELAGIYPDYAEHAALRGDPNEDAVEALLRRRVAA
jgi:hypothetical protein